MKIKYVAQQHEYGCAVACIAMVLGWDYDRVARQFEADFSKRGLRPELTRAFICDHGFSTIEKIAHGFMDVETSNRRMLEPFAPVHILSVTHHADAKTNHAVVMDSKGRFFNPGRESAGLGASYYICRVTGFWPETTPQKRKK